MRRMITLIAGAIVLCGPPGALLAQGGESGGGCFSNLPAECVMLIAHDGSGPAMQQWPRAIVLWRRSPEVTPDTAVWLAVADRRTTEARAATALGRFSLGGSRMGYYSIASFSRRAGAFGADSVFVAGRGFSVPSRDSVLVILVDRLGTLAINPRVEDAVVIPTTGMPPFPYKRWFAGDSLIQLGGEAAAGWQDRLLQSSARVREYLAHAP